VVRFVEKPDAALAAEYLASGEYRWNAGMFVVRAATLLDLLARWHPQLAGRLRDIAADRSRLEAVWPQLTKIAIDHAVAEPAADAGHVVVVPAGFAWDDVGDFASLSTLLPPGDGGTDIRVLGDPADVTAVDATGLLVAAGGRRVAVVGLDDVVVVDTPDALLVTTRARAQDVKRVVDALKAEGRADLT
jgi:mannose-1-phosphate guanylyltransferase